MTAQELVSHLAEWRRCGLHLLIVHTEDEPALRQALGSSQDDSWWSWSVVQGLERQGDHLGAHLTQDPTTMLEKVHSLPEGLVVAYDLSAYWTDPIVVRLLREIAESSEPRLMILVTPMDAVVPVSLERAGLELSLDLTPGAIGWPTTQAEEKWLALAPELATLIQTRFTTRTAGLEWIPEGPGFEELGGLPHFKAWAAQRKLAWDSSYGLPAPRGVLLFGMSGTGKSLSAKVLARFWGLPLVRLNVGQLFGRFIGQSEARWQQALAKAEDFAPCVLWVDEVEKVLAGREGSGVTDAGTTARALGHFLTWLEEHQSPVVVVATANDVEQLPMEFLRRGRFDELFFVDLPDEKARRQILEIHMKSAAIPVERDAWGWSPLMAATEDFSGAELKAIVTDARFLAAERGRAIGLDDFMDAAHAIIPLATTMAEVVAGRRNWAKGRARLA